MARFPQCSNFNVSKPSVRLLAADYTTYKHKNPRKFTAKSGKKCGKLECFCDGLESGEAGLFPFHVRFIVNIHCCLNIRMTHDLLNRLEVRFVFTIPGAESVPQVMT